jgi:hypothetical protein
VISQSAQASARLRLAHGLVAVASVGGAAASSSAFGTQTYAIRLAYPGSTSSTGGCRIAIVSPNDNAVSSTQGTLLPPNWVQVVRCSPGQRVSAISNDAGTFSLSITELTDKWRRKNLTPNEAQAALDALKTHKAPVTPREATELLRLRRTLQAKVDAGQ